MQRTEIEWRTFDDDQSLGSALAMMAVGLIRESRAAGKPFFLGCPAGRSLRSTYQWLGRHAGATDLSHVHLVMMDDYVIAADGRFVPCPTDAHYSCRRIAFEAIRDVINAGRRPSRCIADRRVWLPDPGDPAAYDQQIEQAGGIDLFLLASGASDGHVAFNPPGTSLESSTRIVELACATRQDNLTTFPDFNCLDEVPTHGVTVGLGTIAQLSRRVVLVMHGSDKRHAATRLASCLDFNPQWPASVVHRCARPRVFLDRAAAGPDRIHSCTTP